MIIAEGLCSLLSVGKITPVLDIRFTFSSRMPICLCWCQIDVWSYYLAQFVLLNLALTRLYSNNRCLPTKNQTFSRFSYHYHSQHGHKILNWISCIFHIFQSSLLCLCTQMNVATSATKSPSLLLHSILVKNLCKMILSQFACHLSLLKLSTVTVWKLLGDCFTDLIFPSIMSW